MEEVSVEESKKILKIMTTPEFKLNFRTQLRARYPLFYITTNEERRYIQFLEHFSRAYGYQCYVWDCFRGMIDLETDEIAGGVDDAIKDPLIVLEHIRDEALRYVNSEDKILSLSKRGKRGVIFVLLDFFRFIDPDTTNPNPDIERRLKSLTNIDGVVSTIITGPTYQVPSVLENLIPVIDFPYPNKEEIKVALWDAVNAVQGKITELPDVTKKIEEQLINAVSGLTLQEAQTSFAKSLVSHKGWDIPTILDEKKQIISKSGILEFYNKTVSMNSVGGLKNLINWIIERKKCFSEEAEKYGLSKPRGLLTIGLPGCGKSLVCKAIANSWEMPLLRMDFGRLFSSHVGSSEFNARNAIKLAESVAPCVLWIDEIEKAISGVKSSGQTDGGTTSRVLSTFLTWMQEKDAPVFVVATANDHSSIPAEFLRAGRFDEIFFVDLPNEKERREIFSVLLNKRGYKVENFDIDLLSTTCNNFSGAEIEKAIDKAQLRAYVEKRKTILDKDIIQATREFKTLAEMRPEDFEELREWAKISCIKANLEEEISKKENFTSNKSNQKLDI